MMESRRSQTGSAFAKRTRRRPILAPEQRGVDTMAMVIKDDCISCGACEPECPNESISQGDTIYVIDAAKCTECVGAHDSPKCVEVCPVDGCVVKLEA